MDNLLKDMKADMDARHDKAEATPDVLYLAWPKPLRVGMVKAGHVTVGARGIYYANRCEVRRIPDRDKARIAAAEQALLEAQHSYGVVLKLAWKHASPLSPEELVAIGAEDRRGIGD